MPWTEVGSQHGPRTGPIMTLAKTGAIRMNRALFRIHELGQYKSYQVLRDEEAGKAALVFRHDEQGNAMVTGGKSGTYSVAAKWYSGPTTRVAFETSDIGGEFALIFDVPTAEVVKPKAVKKSA